MLFRELPFTQGLLLPLNPRNPEYPVRTHACTGRTCKLHAERPPAGNRTQDLLAGDSATNCVTVQPQD
ncbi:hypothetical protein ILYODFUR_005484 [Ilyodon furcidens]|uniref:Uncharacterized protein n=1 Tax=Ilyodon furcidens TaxID=33524 RepID=A0ABV0UQP0_9TELE